MQLSHGWSRATPIFDDERLVSCAGLVPVMALAEKAGLSELISGRVAIKTTRVASAGVNPVGKLGSIIAGMAYGAGCIDDLDLIRSGGMRRLFDQVPFASPKHAAVRGATLRGAVDSLCQ